MAAAEECDTELLFMPAGGTSGYQPLDYRIFGELKPRAKGEMARFMVIHRTVDIEYDQNVSILVKY
jgi:L-serine deaminase